MLQIHLENISCAPDQCHETIRKVLAKVRCQKCDKAMTYEIKAGEKANIVAVAEAEHCGNKHRIIVRLIQCAS